MKRFKKIKWDRKEITLIWTTESGTETHAHELVSKAAPHKDLDKALQALAGDVMNVCEIDCPIEDLRVQSVSLSFSEKSGLRGAVVTGLKSVEIANAPVVLNTPHLSEDGEQEKGVMPGGMWKRILKLEDEAQAYLDGKKAPASQIDMLMPGEADAQTEAEDGAIGGLDSITLSFGDRSVTASPETMRAALDEVKKGRGPKVGV